MIIRHFQRSEKTLRTLLPVFSVYHVNTVQYLHLLFAFGDVQFYSGYYD